MSKNTVLVIFGGQSSEHSISLRSAGTIISNLDKEKYNVLTLGITRSGEWLLTTSSTDEIETGLWEENEDNKRAVLSPDALTGGLIVFLDEGKFEIIKIHAVFGALHGMYGEDGTIQGLFELANIPYVGCDVTSSAICMDKVYCKMIMDGLDIAQAKWMYFTAFELKTAFSSCIEQAEEFIDYPMFIKPSRAGSSVGISCALGREELIAALANAAKYDDKIVIEEALDIRELECAVMGKERPVASLCGEIIPSGVFYDYNAKYHDENTRTDVTAQLDPVLMDGACSMALRAYSALSCGGMARVDLFLEKGTNRILFNEINTIPGFTEISMFPKMMEAIGVDIKKQIDMLIELAFEHRKNRRALLI